MGIYVGNLSYDVTEEDLRSVFAEYGTVRRVTLPRDRETGRLRGFAFIDLSSETEEQAAIDALDGAEWKGRDLRVNLAKSRKIAGSRYTNEESSAPTSQASAGYAGTTSSQADDIQGDIAYFNKYLSKASSSDTDCQIVLDGELEEVSKADLQILIYQLRKISGDASINIIGIEKGSIVLKLSGSEEGFKIIRELWKTGKIESLIGLPIEAIYLEIDSLEESKALHSNSLNNAKNMSNTPADSSVTHVNVFNQSTVYQSTQTSLSKGASKTDMSENYTNNFQDSNVANMANVIKEQGRQQANQNINASELNALVVESANEVKAILKRLERQEPNLNSLEKIEYLNGATQPKFKRRLVKALTDGGEAAIDKLFENSYVGIVKAAIKGWMNP